MKTPLTPALIKQSKKPKALHKTFAMAIIRNPFPIWPTPAA